MPRDSNRTRSAQGLLLAAAVVIVGGFIAALVLSDYLADTPNTELHLLLWSPFLVIGAIAIHAAMRSRFPRRRESIGYSFLLWAAVSIGAVFGGFLWFAWKVLGSSWYE
jgi:FtsH-binding integral membrane protein